MTGPVHSLHWVFTVRAYLERLTHPSRDTFSLKSGRHRLQSALLDMLHTFPALCDAMPSGGPVARRSIDSDVHASDDDLWRNQITKKVAEVVAPTKVSVASRPSSIAHRFLRKTEGQMNTTARAAELQGLLHTLEELVLPFVAAGDVSKLRSNGHANGASAGIKHSSSNGHSSESNGSGFTHVPRPLVDLKSPEELSKLANLEIPAERLGEERLVQQIEQVLKYSVNPWDQGFMDKLYSATNPVGVIAETLLAILNTNVHVYSVSPMLTLIERATTRLLADLVGFTSPNAGGFSQPGGSASNQTSVVIARNILYPETKAKGNGSYQFRLFTSAHGHYSVEKAAQMYGFGSEAVIPVPVDEEGRMIPSELDRLVTESKAKGETPFYVNATAGTTVFGAYDPFEELSAVCKRHGLWLHVDASWGGGVVFNKKLRESRMKGVELVDSVGLTPHKMLTVPLTSSFLILNDLRKAWIAMRLEAGYLFHTDLDESPDAQVEIYDLGQLTPQCGRKGDALKLFLSLQYYGLDYYSKAVEAAFERAKGLYNALKVNPNFKVVTPSAPACLQVCFYYHPEEYVEPDAMSARTAAIATRLAAQEWMTDYAPGEQGKFFRVVCNINLREDTLIQFVEAVEAAGAEVVAEQRQATI